MPIVQIHLMENRTDAQKRALVKGVTQAVVDSLGASPKNVRVILSEMAPNNYAVAGELVMDQDDPFNEKKK